MKIDNRIYNTIAECNKIELKNWLADVTKELDFFEVNQTPRRYQLELEKKLVQYRLGILKTLEVCA